MFVFIYIGIRAIDGYFRVSIFTCVYIHVYAWILMEEEDEVHGFLFCILTPFRLREWYTSILCCLNVIFYAINVFIVKNGVRQYKNRTGKHPGRRRVWFTRCMTPSSIPTRHHAPPRAERVRHAPPTRHTRDLSASFHTRALAAPLPAAPRVRHTRAMRRAAPTRAELRWAASRAVFPPGLALRLCLFVF